MRIRQLGILLCASLFLVLTACDSGGANDEDDGNDTGEVNVSITGDGVDESFDGSAFFFSGTNPETDEQAFIVYLFSGEEYDQSASTLFFGRESGRPGTGSYSVADIVDSNDPDLQDQFVLAAGVGVDDNQSGTTYLSSSGSVELETSSEDRVTGSIDVQATGFTVEEGEVVEQTVSITGSFEAPQRNQFVGMPFN